MTLLGYVPSGGHGSRLNISIQRGRLDALFNAMLGGLGGISSLVLTFYGAALVLRGDMSLGTMLAYTALAGGFLANLSNLNVSLYAGFLRANPDFLALREQRVTSYWDCYHRSTSRSEYAGFQVLDFFKRLAAAKE